jgi:hypothetical protein
MPTQVTAVPAAPPSVAEAHFAAEFTFETDCWDGAARGALRLAKLGRPVKIMAGGITGWIDEDFELATSASPA